MLARSPLARALRPKKCAAPGCTVKFVPRASFQKACSPDCALALVDRAKAQAAKVEAKRQREAAKAERAEIKKRKDELKPLQHFLKRTEKAVNAYCRERDREDGCISCGTHDADEWHAGHFIPVGRKSSTRYDPANINKQCRSCNYFGAGKATDYEARLIPKIGLAEVERLKRAPSVRNWTREELLAIEAEFKAKLRALQASRGEILA